MFNPINVVYGCLSRGIESELETWSASKLNRNPKEFQRSTPTCSDLTKGWSDLCSSKISPAQGPTNISLQTSTVTDGNSIALSDFCRAPKIS